MRTERDSLSANIMTRVSLLLAPVMLAGCFNDSPSAKFIDYQERIANVQESDLLPPPELTLVELPSKRELTKEIPRTTLGLVDSYQLRKCQLFGLIAERNSVLGKVQDQFRNFDYQLKLIDGLERCLASNQIELELKMSLQDILSVKYQYLPDYFFNLVYTSDAMRSQLNGHDWLVANKGSTALQVRESLTAFNQVAQFITTSDRATIERPPLLTPHQEQLEKSNVIGRLAFSLEASALWMRTITNQLNTYDDQLYVARTEIHLDLNTLLMFSTMCLSKKYSRIYPMLTLSIKLSLRKRSSFPPCSLKATLMSIAFTSDTLNLRRPVESTLNIGKGCLNAAGALCHPFEITSSCYSCSLMR